MGNSGSRVKVCVPGDAGHCEQAQRSSIPFKSVEDLKKLENLEFKREGIGMCNPFVDHGFSAAEVVVNETMQLSIADQGGDLKCKLPRDIQLLWHSLLGSPVQVKNG